MANEPKKRITIDDTDELLQLVREGMIEEVIKLVFKDVERIVRTVCIRNGIRNESDIEEISSETHIGLLKALRTWRGECKLSSLVWRIAEFKCIDWWRKKGRDVPTESVDARDDQDGANPEKEWPDGQRSLENRLCTKRAIEQFKKLHPSWYDVLSEVVFAGRSALEIAEDLGKAYGTVRNDLWRMWAELARLCVLHCGKPTCEMD